MTPELYILWFKWFTSCPGNFDVVHGVNPEPPFYTYGIALWSSILSTRRSFSRLLLKTSMLTHIRNSTINNFNILWMLPIEVSKSTTGQLCFHRHTYCDIVRFAGKFRNRAIYAKPPEARPRPRRSASRPRRLPFRPRRDVGYVSRPRSLVHVHSILFFFTRVEVDTPYSQLVKWAKIFRLIHEYIWYHVLY